jgi:hypothetical protein
VGLVFWQTRIKTGFYKISVTRLQMMKQFNKTGKTNKLARKQYRLKTPAKWKQGMTIPRSFTTKGSPLQKPNEPMRHPIDRSTLQNSVNLWIWTSTGNTIFKGKRDIHGRIEG